MTRKKKTKKKINPKRSLLSKKNIAIVLLLVIVSISIVYAVNYFEIFKTQPQSKIALEDSTRDLIDKMKKMLDDEKKKSLSAKSIEKKQKIPTPPSSKLEQVAKLTEFNASINDTFKKIEKENDFSEIRDYKKSLQIADPKIKIPEQKVKVREKTNQKPKLAIIIDDVAFANQIEQIKKIPFKVTPSFFPPTKRHPDTVALSEKFDFAMIHIPMQALSFTNPEPQTLLISDSSFGMRQRVIDIKKWFPNIHYYNNHTGSKFTADLSAMQKFLSITKDEKIHFVDSRTTAQTKALQVAKQLGMSIYSRDVFLDNELEPEKIRAQLLAAIKTAKKNGFAIAIGHPHNNTLSVLQNAGSLLQDIDVVYVKDL